MISKILKIYVCKFPNISGVKALPITRPIIIRAGVENIFGLCIGIFWNLIAIDEVKIAPNN